MLSFFFIVYCDILYGNCLTFSYIWRLFFQHNDYFLLYLITLLLLGAALSKMNE